METNKLNFQFLTRCNIRWISIVLVVLFIGGCSKDDGPTIEKEILTTTKVTSLILEPVSDFTGDCAKKFDFEAEIEADGPTTVKYTWLRSDGATAPEHTLEFEGAGTKTVTTSWTLGAEGESYEGYWQQLKVITPREMLSNKAEFNLICDEEAVGVSVVASVTGEDEFTGGCPKKFDFEAEIEADGPTTVKYTWLRSDGGTAPDHTLEFEGAGTKTVTTSWTLGAEGGSYEDYWQQIKVIAPTEMLSNKAEFNLICDEEEVDVSVIASVTGEDEFAGDCPKKFDFEAEIEADGPTTVKYTWLRSDGGTAPEHTLEFDEAGTQTVTTSWTFGGAGRSYEGYWQQLKIIAPNEILSNKAEFTLECADDVSIEMVSIVPSSPAELNIGERVKFKFNYTTNESTGVRIFGRPITDGSPTPGFGAHASEILPTGEGSGSGYFTLREDGGHVDQIRFQMWDADQNNLLYEYFVDVDYEYITHKVELDKIGPRSPATLVIGDVVKFNFTYKTNEAGGVRIFGRPFTDGSPTPGYEAHSSPILDTGDGTGSGHFIINTPVNVDQVRFQMWDADQNTLLYEYFVDVDYTFTE